jgi:hypothetical protein
MFRIAAQTYQQAEPSDPSETAPNLDSSKLRNEPN